MINYNNLQKQINNLRDDMQSMQSILCLLQAEVPKDNIHEQLCGIDTYIRNIIVEAVERDIGIAQLYNLTGFKLSYEEMWKRKLKYETTIIGGKVQTITKKSNSYLT